MGTDSMPAYDHYGIGAVAKLTGLTDHTIRVWERRYEAVVAQRAANGRRIYTPADVEKLRLLKRLTDEGLAIGQIAGSSIGELRERAQTMADIGAAAAPERIRVAVLGDFLPGQLGAHGRNLAPVEIVVADNSQERIAADVSRQSVDVMVMECPVLDAGAMVRLSELMRQSGADRGVVLYNFGRNHDVESAIDARVIALRAPARIDEVRAAIIRAFSPAPSQLRADPETQTGDSEWQTTGAAAPRRFNQQQLAVLAQTSTAIDCECPQHLAQLVTDLSAFEIYSANCANRNADDAALHAYLHQTTAEARAMIEVALERVAKAEGLSY